MSDPLKFKSVSVSIKTYQILDWLRKGKINDAELTISKTIESLAKKKAKDFVMLDLLKKSHYSLDKLLLIGSYYFSFV